MRLTAIRDTQQDCRYAWRQLRHAPGFTTVAVLTLALGIGANTALVGIIGALAASRAPSVTLDGLLVVTQVDRSRHYHATLSTRQYRLLETQLPPGALGITGDGAEYGVRIQKPGRAEYVFANFIPGSYGRFFGIAVQRGRWIAADDDASTGAAPVVVVSDRLWREWLGGRDDAIGTASIRIDLKPFTVIGVAPAGFRGLRDGFDGSDLWLPLGSVPAVFADHANIDKFLDLQGITTFLRPQAKVSSDQLAAQVRAVMAGGPAAPASVSTALPAPTTPAFNVGSARAEFPTLWETGPSWLMLGLAGLILLAACANLANLLYARGTQRASEVAVRNALGASRGRLLRLFTAETAIISCFASVIGFGLALGAMQLFAAATPAFSVSRFGSSGVDLSPNYGVFLRALGVGAAAAMAVGLATAWRASRVAPLRTLAASGAPGGLTARGGGTRTALVAIQVTVAVVLVMAAGVAVERYATKSSGPPIQARYDENLLVRARVDLEQLHLTEVQGRAFFDEMLARVRALPGVDGAAIADGLPTSDYTNLTPEDPPGGRVGSPRLTRVYYGRVSPGFLSTIGVRLVRGRDFTPFDLPGGERVAILSESAASDLSPNADPIGKRVKFGPWDWLTVVGVMADPVSSADRGPARPSNVMFIPFGQWYKADARVIVRSTTPAAVLDPLRLAINEVNEDVAVFEATTWEDEMRRRSGPERAMDVLMASLGVLALGIAMLGVYGVIAYFVSTRMREFGIRQALGATPGRVMKLVIDHAVHVVLVGLLPGVFIVSVGSRFVQSQVRGMMPNDIATWVTVPLLILAAGLLAGYIPARRASRVDPNVALREL